MSIEQHIQQRMNQNSFDEHTTALEKWKSLSSAKEEAENNTTEGFDCNICLDTVQDPVVTFCGHLYCWPCMYKWIHSQSVVAEDTERKQPQCPVCKAEVSEKTLIPLYGGCLTPRPAADSKSGNNIPQRPLSPRCNEHVFPPTSPNPSDHLHQRNFRQPPLLQQPHIGPAVVNHPTNGMFGEMVYTRMFGNPTTLYPYPNSYNLAPGGSNLRMRRQMMNADRSLSRICFFIFCCLVLCLLLF